MRTVLTLLVLLGAGLAGCTSGDSGGVQGDGFSDEVDQELQATDTTGVIRGVVVDETITPLPEAQVVLAGQDRSTTTNADGAFGFSDLDPGTYFVTVSKAGYKKIQSATEVEAGDAAPPVMKVQLARVPSLDPFSETRHFEGFIQCSLAFSVNAIALCSVPEIAGVELGDKFAVRYDDMATPPDHVQSEMDWRSTQALGQTLKMRYTDDHNGGLDNYRTDEGQAPLRVTADNMTLIAKHFDARGLLIRVFPSYNEPPGVVLILQQSFDVYTSAFWNYAPPEDWWFLDEGQRPEPPR